MSLDLSRMDNAQLVQSIHMLARRQQELDADLLLHLSELDARQLYRDLAFPSMFAYLVGALGLSEDVASNRIDLIRLVRRLPAALDFVRSGDVHLSGLRLLSRHLTADNHLALLQRATKKSKRQIEELVAEIAPQPPIPDSIRKVPQRTLPVTALPATSTATPSAIALPDTSPVADLLSTSSSAVRATSPSLELLSPTPARSSRVQPLSAETYKIQFTGTRALRDKLNEAKDLLRHSVPDGELSLIIEQALDLLIARVKKQRFGVGPRARTPKAPDAASSSGAPSSATENAAVATTSLSVPAAPSSTAAVSKPSQRTSRHIPDAIKREVYTRDAGRCTFVSHDGRRCGATARLEFDHLDGFARTHEHRAERITLRCSTHNQLGAETLYGRDFMRQARRSIRPGADSSCHLLPLDSEGLPGPTPS